MELTRKEVQHIADLANLKLNSEELEKFGQQMAETLEYIKKLDELDTKTVEPTAQITGLQNSWREDKAKKLPDNQIDKILKQAPESEAGYVKVKRVLDF